MVPYALHGGDPLSMFKINEFSQRIREDFAKGHLFEGLIEKNILNNTHKLTLLMIPDTTIAEQEQAAETSKLQALKKALTEEEKDSLVQEAY